MNEPEQSIDKIKAKRITYALENGTVPLEEDIPFFSVGRRSQLLLFSKTLEEVGQGSSEMHFINGDYGAGKTHFLTLTRQYALDHGFAVTHVTLSSREAPLDKPSLIYQYLLQNLKSPQVRDRPAFRFILESWSDIVSEKVHNDEQIHSKCKHGLTYLTCGFDCLNELYFKHLPDIFTIGADYQNALKFYQITHLRGDTNAKDLIDRWFCGEKLRRGEKNLIKRLSPDLRIMENIDDNNAFERLEDVARLSRLLGLQGLVIFLDEAESIPSISQRYGKFSACINLIKLVILSEKQKGVYFIYATTPTFYNEFARVEEILRFPEIKKGEEILDKFKSKQVELDPLSERDCQILAEKISHIYEIANDAFINASFVKEKSDQLYRESGPGWFNTRDYITNLMFFLKNQG